MVCQAVTRSELPDTDNIVCFYVFYAGKFYVVWKLEILCWKFYVVWKLEIYYVVKFYFYVVWKLYVAKFYAKFYYAGKFYSSL